MQNKFRQFKMCKKIIGAYSTPPRPQAVFYHSHFVLALWETQSYINKTARAISA